MVAEANRMSPMETGGLLLGYWEAENSSTINVKHIVGPGGKANHELDYFEPDYEFQESELARLYAASGRRLHYLGDWHTHPNSEAYLSLRDKMTIRSIARYADARNPNPLMVVMGHGSPWIPRAWRYPTDHLGRLFFFYRDSCPSRASLQVRVS